MKALALLLVTVALVHAATAGAAAPEPPKRIKTVVVGVQGRRGVDPELARAMADVVQSVLTQDKGRVVLGRADIEQVVKLEAEKQAMGCNDSSCLSEVATAMDADRIVTGTMDKVGASFLIVLTEIDARALEPLARVEVTVPADESRLIEAVRAAARDLAYKSPRIAPSGPSVLVITSLPAGAQVYVDDKLYGTTPATTAALPAGNHKVTLRPTGAPVVEFTVPTAANGPTAVDVRVGAPGAITPEALADLDERRTWNTIWGSTKLGVGSLCMLGALPFCCLGCYGATTIGDGFEDGIDTLLAGGLGITGLLVGVPGAGLATWGVLDFVNPPVPDDSGTASTVVVTPPGGAPRTFQVPFPVAY